jgi:hypothetical protein
VRITLGGVTDMKSKKIRKDKYSAAQDVKGKAMIGAASSNLRSGQMGIMGVL